MKIIVTGSNGFVGKHLIELLKKNKENIIFPLDFKQADITKYAEVKAYLEKIKPDQVYHLAGFASGAGKDKDLIFKVNIEGTLNILKALKVIGKPVRILLASTAYVYGNTPVCVKEDGKIDTKSFYDQSKIKMEEEGLKYQNGKIKIVITRASNHTGPGQKLGFAVPDFCSQITKAKDDAEIIIGNLSAQRDLFDVRDCVRAYELIMRKGMSGEIYNIGTGKTIEVKKILEMLIKISSKNISYKIDSKKMRPSDIEKNCVDSSKVSVLGWAPKIALEKTLRDTYNYFEILVK
ncbi:MAG: Polysaccharide biosynthesis protein [Berkelbacteria bacterium GW2011_GWA1_36_9]|uniref:Polysaccharide biosynthesis protein n=1 Tax=Berkelbacteria bacterium GW2011_GWA1_36_9 TaxID=1618331 RepID=A0A0G0FVS2_9BACT|nr:MAG: Polysaccharide biosynthesis protein [Berkelbacteria bacterium GW2011_GWA1_36_9]